MRRISLANSKSNHGSPAGYSRGCKCKACTKAHREYQQKYYIKRKSKSEFKWIFAFNDLNTALALSLLGDKNV